MSKSISFNPIRRLVSKIIGYICTKQNSRLVVRWPTKNPLGLSELERTVGGFLYFICMISFLFAWLPFNFCGFVLSACLYLHGSFFIGVFSFLFSFAWFHFYSRGFIFICMISFLFAWLLFNFCGFFLSGCFVFTCVVLFSLAWFHFYLRGFFSICLFSFLYLRDFSYVCSVSLVGHQNRLENDRESKTNERH